MIRDARAFPSSVGAALKAVVLVGAISSLASCGDSSTSSAPSTVVTATTQPAAPTTTATTSTTIPPTVATTEAPTIAEPSTTLSAPLMEANMGVAVQPGTYTVDGRGSGGSSGFPIRYELTTSGAWTGRGNEPKYLFLDRNGSFLFAVTSGLLQGSTPEEVIANACPGGRLDLKPTTATTLLGSAAIKASGTVAAACAIPYGGFGELDLDIGETVVIVVGGVDGHMVAVLGDIPATNAQALNTEFDAMVASMKLIA